MRLIAVEEFLCRSGAFKPAHIAVVVSKDHTDIG